MLANWKANHLSLARRVTLAKSVIEAVPLYPMMTTIIPKACIEEIQKLQRKFVWGDTEVSRRYHAVGWETMSKPKTIYGLGLRRLDVMNKACIMKLGWSIYSGSNSLCTEVMRGKYQRSESLEEIFLEKPTDSSLWKALVKLWPEIERNLVDSNGNWNWEKLKQWLPFDVLQRIMAIATPHENLGSDKLIWPNTASGNFKVARFSILQFYQN